MQQITETSAGGMVYKKENEKILWLLIKHAGSEKGHWSFPKGHIGDKVANEKMEEAALREVEEEGGVKAKIVNDTPVTNQYWFKLHNILRKKTVYYFLMEYISGDPANHDHEVTDATFVTEDEAMKMITFENDKKAFQKALQLFT